MPRAKSPMPFPGSNGSRATRLADYLARFAERRVLLLGDLILDQYLHGSVTRVSPEAPVPILAVEEEEFLPGGAANVACNLAALGSRVDVVGIRGDDAFGKMLVQLFADTRGIKPFVTVDSSRPTTLKSRCVARGQQMLRLDRERTTPISAAIAKRVQEQVATWLIECDGLIISDYGKGLLTPGLLADVIEIARKLGKPVFVDPKGHDYRRYRGATLLTPNQKEAREASGVPIEDDASLARAAKVLLRTVQANAVFITRGSLGVSIFPRTGAPIHEPARALEVFDVTGAGDSFLAVSALTLLSGGSYADAARLGNAAAGIVVGRFGVACPSPAEIAHALEQISPTATVAAKADPAARAKRGTK